MLKSIFLGLGLVLSLAACTPNSKESVLSASDIGLHHRLYRLFPDSTISMDAKGANGAYTLSMYLAPDFTGIRHVAPVAGSGVKPETRQITRWWMDQNNRFCVQFAPIAAKLASVPSAWTCYGLKISQASELTLIDARQQEMNVRQTSGNQLEAQGQALQAELQRLYGAAIPTPIPPTGTSPR